MEGRNRRCAQLLQFFSVAIIWLWLAYAVLAAVLDLIDALIGFNAL